MAARSRRERSKANVASMIAKREQQIEKRCDTDFDNHPPGNEREAEDADEIAQRHELQCLRDHRIVRIVGAHGREDRVGRAVANAKERGDKPIRHLVAAGEDEYQNTGCHRVQKRRDCQVGIGPALKPRQRDTADDNDDRVNEEEGCVVEAARISEYRLKAVHRREHACANAHHADRKQSARTQNCPDAKDTQARTRFRSVIDSVVFYGLDQNEEQECTDQGQSTNNHEGIDNCATAFSISEAMTGDSPNPAIKTTELMAKKRTLSSAETSRVSTTGTNA